MAKQIRTFQLVLKRIRAEEDNAVRQEFVTRVIFTLTSAGVVIISTLVFGLVLANQADPGSIILTLVIDFVVILGWILIAAGRWRFSASLLPLASLVIAGYMVFTAGPFTTGVLQLVLAVLLAGMLSGNKARWVMVALSSLVYLVAGWASGGLDLETSITSGPLLVVTLVVIGLLERFFTDQLDKSQATVREREVELESIFRAAPVGIGMVVDRVITEANPTLCQMTGYTREELVRNSTRMLYLTQEEFKTVGVESHRQINQCGQGTVETRWRCKDGTVRDILLSSVPLDLTDLARGITFSALDVTERKKAEEELRKSKQALEEAERLVHLGHYEIDAGTGETLWSEEIFNIFGLDRNEGEPTVETYNALIHPDDRAIVYAMYEESRQKRIPFDLIYRILRKDGNLRYVRSYASLVEDAAGNAKLFGTFQDITELKQVELALQESQALYQDLVETAQDLIWQCDQEGHYVYLNPAWENVFGYELHEMLGKPFTAFQPPEYARRDKSTFLHLLEGNSVANYETVHLAKDGSELQLAFNAKAVRDQQGNILGTRGTAFDITERKQAEVKLRESAARYQAVVENQTEFIVRWKPDGTRTFTNEAYLRYFNLTQEEALASGFLPLVAEEDRGAIEGKVSRLVSGQAASETDVHRVYRPDGSIGWQEWTDHAIYNDQGEIVEFQSIGRDVTERIQAEEALRTKTEELEALFSISAHLRTAPSADAMLPVVLEEMRRVLRSDANAVILLEPDLEQFIYALSDGPLTVNTGEKFRVENSISGLVLQTGQPYLTEDLSSDPQKSSTVKGDAGLGPAIFVPVISESDSLGVLLCAREKNGASQRYSSSEVRLLTAIGEMVGNAMRRARLYDQALKRMQHLQTLHSIDTAISANLDLGVILDVLLTQGVVQLDVDAASVLLLNPHTHMLEFAAGKGFRTPKVRSFRLRIGEGLPGKVALERRMLHATDLPNDEHFHRKFLLEEGFVTYQGAPLIAKGQLQGVLEIFNRGTLDIDEERTEFLETLATQAAIAIDNSQLFSDLQRTNFELEMAYDATIEGWSRALELRDMETEGHTLRVTDMTVQLAQEMCVSRDDLIHIRRGALLHDIGKMGVPDRILLKPGKLDDEEWEVMKRHTVYAYKMLWPIDFLRPAIDIPYCHHERWDGTGYPRQLKAEQIPLSARLFSVADVWDALTSNRPYRKAWTERKALEYIKSNAGKQFDPQVVEAFLILRSKQGREIAFD